MLDIFSIRKDSRLALLLEDVDEGVGATVVLADLALAVELAEDALGELLAELDTPLVEGVDVPDGALDESEVLVVSDQGTESTGGDLLGQDGGGGPVAEEGLVGNELIGSALGLDGFGVLPTMRASDCAKKLEASMRWCLLPSMGLWDSTARMKSVGMSLVPWWRSWKKECWELVPGSPKRMGPVVYLT